MKRRTRLGLIVGPALILLAAAAPAVAHVWVAGPAPASTSAPDPAVQLTLSRTCPSIQPVSSQPARPVSVGVARRVTTSRGAGEKAIATGPTATGPTATGPTATGPGTTEPTGPSAPVITSAPDAAFAQGEQASFGVIASGSPTAAFEESGPLPSGVSFSDTGNGSAILAGIAAVGTLGTYPITITADNGIAPAATQNFVLSIDPPLVITSAAATTFTEGTAGMFDVTASGTPAPTFSETGPLPDGVFLSDDGTLAGTPYPQTAGTYPFTIVATNGVIPVANQSFVLTVTGPPTFTSPNGAVFAQGSSCSFTVSTNALPTAAISESGPLPSGVGFADNGNGTATLAGTPAVGTVGSYPVTLTADNGSSPDATQDFVLTVGEPPVITSAPGATFVIGSAGSFTVQAGGAPQSSFSETGALPSGVSLSSDGVLSGTPVPGRTGTYPVTITADNGIEPSATQNFVLTLDSAPAVTSAATATFIVGQPGSFTATGTGFPLPALSESGPLPGGVTFADNGNGTGSLAGTPAAGSVGTYPISITADNGVGAGATEAFVLTVDPPLVFTNASSAVFTEGTPGSFTFLVSGTPTPTFSTAGRLPAGVSLSSGGVLSGTPGPGTSGTYPLTVTASNGVAPNVTQSFSLKVQGPPVITSNPQTVFTPLTAGSFTIESRTFPAPTFSETGVLPYGLTLTSAGTLSGTPAQGSQGTYPITIKATNGFSPDATQAFTIYVGFVITQTSLPASTLGQTYSASLTTFGALGPHQWTISSGALPPGLHLSGRGKISGTSTAIGTFRFVVQVSGTLRRTKTSPRTHETAVQTLSITILTPPPTAP